MSVFRIHHEKNFTIISNEVLRDENLSNAAKGLAALILSLPDNWNYSEMGLKAISKDGRTAIRNQLKELEEQRYLIRTKVKDEQGHFTSSIYDFYEHPQNVCSPLSENQTSDFQTSDFPTSVDEYNKGKTEEVKNEEVKNEEVKSVSTDVPTTPSEPSVQEVKSVKKPKSKRTTIVNYIDSLTIGDVIKEDIKNWLTTQNKIPNEKQMEVKLKEVYQFFNNNEQQIHERINLSFINGYRGWIFKGEKNQSYNNSSKSAFTPAVSTALDGTQNEKSNIIF